MWELIRNGSWDPKPYQNETNPKHWFEVIFTQSSSYALFKMCVKLYENILYNCQLEKVRKFHCISITKVLNET